MFRWRKERDAELQRLSQRITELERELASARSSARPDLISALADMTVKQSEASSKLLTTVTDAAERTAARALGRKRASTADRSPDGRYVKKGTRAQQPTSDCPVCQGRAVLTTVDVDRHYAEGHPAPRLPVNGGSP